MPEDTASAPCFLLRSPAQEAPSAPQKLEYTDRAIALAAFAAAADGACSIRPAIELCAREVPGKSTVNVSVKAAQHHDGDGRKGESHSSSSTSTSLSTPSGRSVGRMLRLLCAPVQSRSAGAGAKGRPHSEQACRTEADSHVDASRVTVTRAPVFAPKGNMPPGRLTGRFGTLTTRMLYGGPAKKARTGRHV